MTGKRLTRTDDFRRLAAEKGFTDGETLKPGVKAGDIVAWLKHDFDLGHGHLVQPARPVGSEAVQRLTLDHLPQLKAVPPQLHTGGFGSLEALLREGLVAGALVGGQIVAIARTSARSDRHGDISVATLEAWRNHGFATAAASLVAQELQAAGQIPVWSAGAQNAASLRVAEKLGFTEIARRRYVIIDQADQ